MCVSFVVCGFCIPSSPKLNQVKNAVWHFELKDAGITKEE